MITVQDVRNSTRCKKRELENSQIRERVSQRDVESQPSDVNIHTVSTVLEKMIS